MDMVYLTVAIIMGLGAVSAPFSISLLGSKLLETSARQPELAPALQTKFFIIAGLVEALPIIGVGISMYLIFVVA
ncbi:F0F1 ATP synthase subunit C [Natronospirillum operosum]|uniref:ATP synthase F(0) sector subunit c n=1 Tax=Natronospirillum operosum TaxID=2759953 RepID=A0A4Z0W7F2_9GAMM|nr:F0F1 ATP synthase subunit C [Natronospirillum operosum]TGG91470.1 F0F1 ATP synthase subunit C [Natronospirillum operosum]